MRVEDCRHGMRPDECAVCGRGPAGRAAPGRDRSGHHELLIHCPELCEGSLLHLDQQGESYRLRAFVGRRAGEIWFEEDAPTASEFLRRYRPAVRMDVSDAGVRLTEVDRRAAIVTEHDRRAGLGV